MKLKILVFLNGESPEYKVYCKTFFPQYISADNNVGLHLCWENSDLNEEMPTALAKHR